MKPDNATAVTLWYLLFGSTWIIGSDLVAELLLPGQSLQTIKGLLFIAVTSILIYSLVRRLEKANNKAKEFRQAIIDASPIAMYSIDPDGRVLTWNKAAESIFGWPEEEVLGKHLPIIPGDKEAEFARLRGRVMASGAFTGLEVTRQRKDGSLFPAKLSMAPIFDSEGSVIAIMATMEDISEHRRVMSALEESEEQFRKLVESAPEGILIQVDGRFAYVNAACVALLGAKSPQELLGTRVLDRIHPDDVEIAKMRLESLLHKGQAVSQIEQSIVTVNGNVIPVESVAVPFRYQGQQAGLGFIRDIRQRRAAAHERERLQKVISQTADAIMITDRNGIIEYVNPAFEQSSGYSLESIIGKTPAVQKSGQHEAEFYRDLWDTISNGDTWRGRIVNRNRQGALYTEDVSITPVLNDGEIESYIAVKRDITRELSLQGQLNQAQKMETVGRLAGGVAHDFNNMLSVILGYNELALSKIPSDSSIRNDLAEVASAAQRSASLTRQLLAFARQETIEPKRVDINDSIERSIKMLDRLIGEYISLDWQPASVPCFVKMDPTQIDQILANLAVNARDAITGQGNLMAETERIVLTDDDCAARPGLEPGPFIRVKFSDNGHGMSQEVLERAFEPFFTTKPEGTGTGLGLSTVYGIVKQNRGFVEVESEPGQGTTFMIYLPASDDVVPESSGTRESRGVRVAGETILLVEDELALLRLGQRILERTGYTVLAAGSPSSAIDLALTYDGKIDLLLTDVVMPEMNGEELRQKISEIRPDIRCLFTSGYTSDTGILENLIENRIAFLQKPYTTTSLNAKVLEVLETPIQ
ncbi:MAG: PAS domain S-box protein [Pseudomonadales bacterium]